MLKPSERFPNLNTAGRALAQGLIQYGEQKDAIVLAVALGGVPVAREVANLLRAPLDLILIRRLFIGNEPGSCVCAVNVAGSLLLDDEVSLSDSPSTPRAHFLNDAIAALQRREQLCRRGRAGIDLTNRTLIVVDCGIHTGSTMKAAWHLLPKLKPKRIIGAVPVSSREGYEQIAPLFDEFVCLSQPEEFVNTAYWYEDFRRPGDEEVGELIENF